MSYSAKQNIQTATNILVLIGLIAGGVFYFSNGNEADAKLNAEQSSDIKVLQAAVADVPGLKSDVSQIKIDVAVQRSLLESLSRDRFQYDPNPSRDRALQTIASTTQVINSI